MIGLLDSIFFSAVAGIGGTCLGAIIGILSQFAFGKNNPRKIERITKSLIGFSGGIMITVVCFDLIPASYQLASFSSSISGVVLGCIIVPIFDVIIKSFDKNSAKQLEHQTRKNQYSKAGKIVFFSIALHNFPEGLALGAGFGASAKLGIALAIVIALHNIPEGVAMAVPLKAAKKGSLAIVFMAFICGLPTIIGASIGWFIAGVSAEFIGICLGFAGGAMLYVVIGELFPISYDKSNLKSVIVTTLLGFLIGLLITK